MTPHRRASERRAELEFCGSLDNPLARLFQEKCIPALLRSNDRKSAPRLGLASRKHRQVTSSVPLANASEAHASGCVQEYLRRNPLAPQFSSKQIVVLSFPLPPPLLPFLPPLERLSGALPPEPDSRKSTPGMQFSPLLDQTTGELSTTYARSIGGGRLRKWRERALLALEQLPARCSLSGGRRLGTRCTVQHM